MDKGRETGWFRVPLADDRTAGNLKMQEEKVVRKRILAVASALILCLGLTGTALAGKQERTVYAGTVEELQDALASNTRIILEGRDYSIGSLGIQNLENVTIQGMEGTRILTQYEGLSLIHI